MHVNIYKRLLSSHLVWVKMAVARRLLVSNNFWKITNLGLHLNQQDFHHSTELMKEKMNKSTHVLVPKRSRCNSFTQRTHNCGQLRVENIGDKVELYGWLQYHRYGMFFTLRDSYGNVQCIVPEDKTEVYNLDKLTFESVLQVMGTVRQRPEGQENRKMATGQIEVVVNEMNVLSSCKADLPILPRDHQKANEALRLKYRYLDLRSQELQHNLRLRSTMVMNMRQFLCNDHGFVEVETPTLFRKTPGGAQEFIVPTKHAGKYYSLPQSPQQFKQLLMVGGMDRYVQIARCYRDETTRHDRQPEFTQVDIEMSFVTQTNIQQLVEQLISYSWPHPQTPVDIPFTKMTYNEAISQYGTDKPDTRFDMTIVDVTQVFSDGNFPLLEKSDDLTIKAINAINSIDCITNSEIKEIATKLEQEFANTKTFVVKIKDGGWTGSVAKQLSDVAKETLCQTLEAKSGDMLWFSCGPHQKACEMLGKVRLQCANLIQNKTNQLYDENSFNFLWVEDFPLFLPCDDAPDILESAHHPFTAPKETHQDLLYENPDKVIGQHYDLVLNGYEIGGGSIRIHNAALQRYILEHVLHEDVSHLTHLIEALDSGCPPHGGIALGLDRLAAILCRAPSIKDVIAFPKTLEGRDLMSAAPAQITPQDRTRYHITNN